MRVKQSTFNRRELFKYSTLLGFVPSSISLSQTPENIVKHTTVQIILDGGVDFSMLFPVFSQGSDSVLSPLVDFQIRDVFEASGIPFINHPDILSPNHPLIKSFGSRLSVIHGIEMDSSNDHARALSVMARGAHVPGMSSIACVFGEMLGSKSEYGTIAVGRSPYHAAHRLSQKASGILLPKTLANMSEMVKSQFLFENLNQKKLDDLARNFYSKESSAPARHSRHSVETSPSLGLFRKYNTESDPQYMETLLQNFVLGGNEIDPYHEIPHSFGLSRHEGLALIAKMIRRGGMSGSFIITLGNVPEGPDSYDSHGGVKFAKNNERQTKLLKADMAALAIFLSQIEENLSTTSVIVQSEFARTPRMNSSEGKDHWAANNCFMIFSQLFKKGYMGLSGADYIARGVEHNDGSVVPVTTRSIYRHMIQSLIEQELITTDNETKDRLWREHLIGPIPKIFQI